MLKHFLINIGRLKGENISYESGIPHTVEACKNEAATHEQPEDWSNEIDELQRFFASRILSNEPIKLNDCETVSDAKTFIDSHIATARANNGNKTFLPYLNRLNKLKAELST